MNPFSPRRRLSASRFSLGLMVLSACLGTTPQATTPAPASSPPVGVADTSDTSAGPIYVVDGNVVPPSALAAMNLDDVASVILLRGPDASAAYGDGARTRRIDVTRGR